MLNQIPNEQYEPLQKLSRDLRKAAETLSRDEARFLVDGYYMLQKYRIASTNQSRDLKKSGEPHEVISWFCAQSESLENSIRRALDSYSSAHITGRWAKSIIGIGPVISAGLLAHIDILRAPTVGHIWRFAGLDPTREWLGAERAKEVVASVLNGNKFTKEHLPLIAAAAKLDADKIQQSAARLEGGINRKNVTAMIAKRPWNADLKVLCWKIGESFVKQKGREADVYGKVYEARKALEIERNDRLEFHEQAERSLREKNYGKTTIAFQFYKEGKLPPDRIHKRAERYAVKLFLAHWHHVAFESRFGKPPVRPYVLEHLGEQHLHFIGPPNWPMV